MVTGAIQSWPWEETSYPFLLGPKTHWQIREFLGAAGFCQIWIPNYSLLVKPLYEAMKGGEWGTLGMGRGTTL
jgi:hypothetical protein